MQGIDAAIEKLNKLLTERNSPEWWSANVIDASKLLNTPRDWTLFYSYLADKEHFDKNQQFVTLQDIDIPELPPLHPDMIEERYQNGPHETIIIVKRRSEVDDEKSPA